MSKAKDSGQDQEQPAFEEEKPAQGAPVPLMLELSLTVSKILVIVVVLLVPVLSFVAGASLTGIAIRTIAAILAVGIMMWLVNWVLSRNSLESVRLSLLDAMREAEESAQEMKRRAAEEAFSTLQREA